MNELRKPGIQARRNYAIVAVALCTGARVAEICALDLAQVLDNPQTPGVRIRPITSLRRDQIKGKREAGILILPELARTAIRRWIIAGRHHSLLPRPPLPPHAPLFVVIHACPQKGRAKGDRIAKRTLQNFWLTLQRHLAIDPPYRFHDLRHTFQSFLAEDGAHPYTIASVARVRSVETTVRYVHTRTDELRRAVEHVKW
jgi:integrase